VDFLLVIIELFR